MRMNTQHLKNKWKNIYEVFFSQNKIIFSTPFVLSWTWESDFKYSGIAIKQKIPLRMYIWIKSHGEKWIHFGNIVYRDFSENTFIESPLKEYAAYWKHIEQFINNWAIDRTEWYQISILSELPRWAWMWFDSILSLLLATAVHRLLKNESVLLEDENTVHEDINNSQHPIYDIVRYAELIDSQIKWYRYISSDILTSICPGRFPIVSFSEDTQWIGKKELLSAQDYKFFVYPLNVLYQDIGDTPYSPIDYWVIYSWRPTLSEYINQDWSTKEVTETLAFATQTFSKHISNISANRKPKFYKEILKEHEKWNDFMVHTQLWYNSFEILKNLKWIFQRWYSEDDVKKLLWSITKSRHAHNASKRASSHLSALVTCLQQYFWQRQDLLWISYNNSSIMGWSIFFVTPIEWLRKNILNTLNHAQFDFPWANLLYANRVDGIEEDAVLCEQDLLQLKTSSYVRKNMLMLELPDKNYIFGDHNHLIQSKQVDIILDTIHGKIYTYWQKLTSKDVHSQSWTIEMLLYAIEHIWTDIPNRMLPLSSYSRSKNEMLGKIIIPLLKTIKEKTQKDLLLECYGGVYDYYLRLKKGDVKIGVLKKAWDIPHQEKAYTLSPVSTYW